MAVADPARLCRLSEDVRANRPRSAEHAFDRPNRKPSPRRDGGYDVSDYYGVHPRVGSLGDFANMLSVADERGVRVMLDLVVNHTSDEHPWFVSARSDRNSPLHDWCGWSDTEPPDRFVTCSGSSAPTRTCRCATAGSGDASPRC